MLCSLLGRALSSRVSETLVVKVGNNYLCNACVTGSKLYCRDTHRSCAAKDRDATALLCAVGANVVGVIGVIEALVAAENATDGLNERALEVAVALKGNEASALKNDGGNYRVDGVTANVGVGIAGVVAALKLKSRLDNCLLSDSPLVLKLLADLKYLAAKLVTDNDRLLCYRGGNSLVSSTLLNSLIGRSTDRVCNDSHKHLVFLDFRKLKLFKLEVHSAVKSYAFSFHDESS